MIVRVLLRTTCPRNCVRSLRSTTFERAVATGLDLRSSNDQ